LFGCTATGLPGLLTFLVGVGGFVNVPPTLPPCCPHCHASPTIGAHVCPGVVVGVDGSSTLPSTLTLLLCHPGVYK